MPEDLTFQFPDFPHMLTRDGWVKTWAPVLWHSLNLWCCLGFHWIWSITIWRHIIVTNSCSSTFSVRNLLEWSCGGSSCTEGYNNFFQKRSAKNCNPHLYIFKSNNRYGKKLMLHRSFQSCKEKNYTVY